MKFTETGIRDTAKEVDKLTFANVFGTLSLELHRRERCGADTTAETLMLGILLAVLEVSGIALTDKFPGTAMAEDVISATGR